MHIDRQAYLSNIYWGAREAAVGILAVLACPNEAPTPYTLHSNFGGNVTK